LPWVGRCAAGLWYARHWCPALVPGYLFLGYSFLDCPAPLPGYFPMVLCPRFGYGCGGCGARVGHSPDQDHGARLWCQDRGFGIGDSDSGCSPTVSWCLLTWWQDAGHYRGGSCVAGPVLPGWLRAWLGAGPVGCQDTRGSDTGGSMGSCHLGRPELARGFGVWWLN
jgi:hypothetical protein